MGMLAKLFKNLNRGWLKEMLIGAGITLGTSATGITIFMTMLEKFKDTATGMPPLALTFAHLLGLDVGLSILIGAMLARYTLQKINVNFGKKGQLSLF